MADEQDDPYTWQDPWGNQRKSGTLNGVETVAEGRSLTPGTAQQQYTAAVAKWGQEKTDSFLSRNALDFNRIDEALSSEQSGNNRGSGDGSPTQAWNSQPSGPSERDQLMQLLMQRAQQGSQVSRTDPNVRAQVDPATAQMERSSRDYLDDVAERSGPLANLQGERRLVAERQGQAAGQLEAQVIGREIAAKRDEIQQALMQWGDVLSEEQKIALARELAILEDATRRYGIDVGADTTRYGIDTNNDQFLRDLALREYDTTNKWDYTWSTGG